VAIFVSRIDKVATGRGLKQSRQTMRSLHNVNLRKREGAANAQGDQHLLLLHEKRENGTVVPNHLTPRSEGGLNARGGWSSMVKAEEV